MVIHVPPGARPAARVLVVSDDRSVLLFKGREVEVDDHWWVSPGGGLEAGESFEAAATRELFEETGRHFPIGPRIWTRHHLFEWFGRPHNQFECFFVCDVGPRFEPRPVKSDGYIVGHRWWSLPEIVEAEDRFSPRRLAELLPPIFEGDYPNEPFDAGV